MYYKQHKFCSPTWLILNSYLPTSHWKYNSCKNNTCCKSKLLKKLSVGLFSLHTNEPMYALMLLLILCYPTVDKGCNEVESRENAAINCSFVNCSDPGDLMTNVCKTLSFASESFESTTLI